MSGDISYGVGADAVVGSDRGGSDRAEGFGLDAEADAFETNVRLARFLREMDRRLVALDELDASLFFFVGRVV